MKKRILSLALVIAMLASMMVVPAAAESVPSLLLETMSFEEAMMMPTEGKQVSAVNAASQDTFMVKVSFTAAEAIALGGFSVKMQYNEEAFDLYSYTNMLSTGPVAFDATFVQWNGETNTNTAGTAIWNKGNANALNVEGSSKITLGYLLLKVKPGAENGDYDFSFVVDEEAAENKTYITLSDSSRLAGLDTSAKATVTVVDGAAPTLGSLSLSGEGVGFVEDDSNYYTITVVGGEETPAKTVTATATSTSKKDITTMVTWGISEKPEEAGENDVSIDSATGVITVDANAKAGDYTITATPIANSSQGSAVTATLKVAREASVPANITISGGQAEVLIPATGAEPAESTEFVATVTDQYGENYQGSAPVTWEIEKSEATVDGITIEEGVVFVTAGVKDLIDRGAEKTMTITATCGNQEATAEIVVKREQPAGTTVKLFDDTSSEVSEVNITIPVSGSAATSTYIAKLYDQYGEEMVGDFEWTTEDVVPTGTTMSGGTITVAVNAEGDGTFTLKATDRTSRKSATMEVTVSKLNADWSNTGLTVDESPVYGMANSAIVTAATGTLTYNTDGTESYSKALTGTYTLVDPATVQDAGDRTIAVKFVADNSEENGEYKGIELTGTIPVTIAKKEVTVSGIIAADKTYDGTTTAELNYSNVVFKDSSSVVVSDENLTVTATGVFDSKNKGEGKPVTISGITLSDSAAVNYVLAAEGNQTSTTATITAKEVTVSGITAETKPYDGNTTATLNYSNAAFDGIVSGENLTVTATGAFTDKNAGTGKTVTISGIALGGDAASNYELAAEGQQTSTTANITAKGVTVSGITATSKTYDGTRAAAVNVNSAQIVGVIDGDNVTIDVTEATGTFDTKNAGEGKTVTITGIELGGDDAGNYTLADTGATATANIDKRPITVSGITAVGKDFDGNTDATLVTTGAVFDGIVSGDVLTVTAEGIFGSADAGEDKIVTISDLTLTGTDKGNYELSGECQSETTATINKAKLTISGITAENKVYDGTDIAALNSNSEWTIDGLAENECALVYNAAAVFSDKNAGNGKTVTITVTLSGTDAGNYELTEDSQTSTTANITAKEVTVSGITAVNKPYDGTLAATVNVDDAEIEGVIGEDDVTIDVTKATGTFDTKNVGEGKTVTITGIKLGGTHAGNYTLTATGATAKANITVKEVTVSGITAANKTYNGKTDATLYYSNAIFDGIVSGDNLTVTADGTFADANVGEKTVNISNIKLGGTDAGNYTLTKTTDTTTADITKAALTVTANPKTITYGDAPANDGVEYSGFVNGEGVGALDVTGLDYAYSYEQYGNVGTYSITPKGVEADNYAITFVPGVLTVGQKTIDSLNWYDYSNLYYDGEAKNVTAEANGLVNGDEVEVTVSGGNRTAIGDYTAKATGLTGAKAGNYELAENLTQEYHIVAAVTSVAVTLDTVTAVVDNDKLTITLTGYMTSGEVTLTVNGESAPIDENGQIEVNGVKYTVDMTGVVTMPVGVTVKPETSAVTKPAGAEDSITNDVITQMAGSVVDKLNEAAAALVSKALDGKPATANKAEVEFSLKIEPIALSDGKLTMHIEPQITVTYKNESEELVGTETKPVPNSEIKAPVTITVKVPDDMGAVTHAKHTRDDKTVEYLKVTYDAGAKTATWQQSSFSEVELISNDDTANVTFKFDNGSSQTITYTAENIGQALPTDSKSGSNFAGWKFTGVAGATGTYTTLTAELLAALAADSADDTEPQFTAVAPSRPVRPGVDISDTKPAPELDPEEEETVIPFYDVAPGAYYYDAVQWALEQGITGGTTATTFSPKAACTRGQMVTFLWRAAGMPEPTTTVNPFVDVNASKYYYKAVLWALEEGITGGKTATTFDPNAACTRGQMATFLWRAAGEPTVSGSSVFTDVNAGKYYFDAVLWAAESGITNGKTATTFVPNEACNRGQMVTFLYRNAMAN